MTGALVMEMYLTKKSGSTRGQLWRNDRGGKSLVHIWGG